METVVIDTVIEETMIRIPKKFRNRHVKIIIIDKDKGKTNKPVLKKLNFKVDKTLDDVVPFSDIRDSNRFIENLREKQWQ